jgi:hypothetical protein
LGQVAVELAGTTTLGGEPGLGTFTSGTVVAFVTAPRSTLGVVGVGPGVAGVGAGVEGVGVMVGVAGVGVGVGVGFAGGGGSCAAGSGGAAVTSA